MPPTRLGSTTLNLRQKEFLEISRDSRKASPFKLLQRPCAHLCTLMSVTHRVLLQRPLPKNWAQRIPQQQRHDGSLSADWKRTKRKLSPETPFRHEWPWFQLSASKTYNIFNILLAKFILHWILHPTSSMLIFMNRRASCSELSAYDQPQLPEAQPHSHVAFSVCPCHRLSKASHDPTR